MCRTGPAGPVCGITGCGRLPVPDGGPCAAAELFLRLGAGYRTLAQVQHQRHFSFIPEGSINTPQEFTAALQTYAKANGMQLSLTKEGMYPEFSLDGISYKAYRNPGKYRDEICCDAASPEQLNTGLPSRRERQLQVLRILLPAAFTFAAILAAGWVATGGADWLWLAALAAAGVLLGRCFEHRL